MDMVSAQYACTRISGNARGRKQILPSELLGGIGIFTFQCLRQIHGPEASLEIPGMLVGYPGNLPFKIVRQGIGHRHHPILLALAGAH